MCQRAQGVRLLAYDATLRRPGCAAIQAWFGATPGVERDFPAESWLLGPTPDMRVWEVTDEQVEQLIQRAPRRVLPGPDRRASVG